MSDEQAGELIVGLLCFGVPLLLVLYVLGFFELIKRTRHGYIAYG